MTESSALRALIVAFVNHSHMQHLRVDDFHYSQLDMIDVHDLLAGQIHVKPIGSRVSIFDNGRKWRLRVDGRECGLQCTDGSIKIIKHVGEWRRNLDHSHIDDQS